MSNEKKTRQTRSRSQSTNYLALDFELIVCKCALQCTWMCAQMNAWNVVSKCIRRLNILLYSMFVSTKVTHNSYNSRLHRWATEITLIYLNRVRYSGEAWKINRWIFSGENFIWTTFDVVLTFGIENVKFFRLKVLNSSKLTIASVSISKI